MPKVSSLCLLASATLIGFGATLASAQDGGAADMSFFVTSSGPGSGADLGGLEGADAHCQSLAEAAGSEGRTWRAYLSTQGEGSANARDRIGDGPWANSKGVEIAASPDELHSDANKISKETALDEKGQTVKGRGDQPNRHDILTGSQADRTAFGGSEDMTCSNWTSSSEGAAMTGHHDRMGLNETAQAKSWNSSHPSRGCSQENLASTGGAGLFYCFAAD
jgi:hypothetical protein